MEVSILKIRPGFSKERLYLGKIGFHEAKGSCGILEAEHFFALSLDVVSSIRPATSDPRIILSALLLGLGSSDNMVKCAGVAVLSSQILPVHAPEVP